MEEITGSSFYQLPKMFLCTCWLYYLHQVDFSFTFVIIAISFQPSQKMRTIFNVYPILALDVWSFQPCESLLGFHKTSILSLRLGMVPKIQSHFWYENTLIVTPHNKFEKITLRDIHKLWYCFALILQTFFSMHHIM